MGIPLTIFSLYRLDGEGEACPHHLLLRVPQPGFSNADAGEYDAAVEAAESRRRALIGAYTAGALARECAVPHAVHLVGELQSYPVGEALIDGPGGVDVELWVARTRFGAPLGRARDCGGRRRVLARGGGRRRLLRPGRHPPGGAAAGAFPRGRR